MSEWESQIKRGTLELILLSLINREDQYGRDLIAEINKYGIEVGEGTVYPLLARLMRKGYMSSYLRESEIGPARKYYSITNNGKNLLQKYIISWNDISRNINKLINNN